MSALPLETRLRWVRRATLGRSAAAGAARAVAASIVFLMALVGLDALRPMPPWALAALSATWVLGLLFGVVRSAWRAARAVPDLRATARLVEQRAGVPHNRVINALLFLRGAPGAERAAAGTLLGRAIERGERAMAEASEQAIIAPERHLARRAIWALLIAAGAILGAYVVMPRVFAATLPRYAEPFGDHPPYSLTDFEVTIDPSRPAQGDDVAVTVRTMRKQPASLRLVIRERGMASRSVPMNAHASEAGVHSAVLRGLRAPVRVHAEGSTGRSRAIEIVPDTVPRIVEAAVTITPPAYTGRRAETRAISTSSTETVRPLVGSEVSLHVATTIALGGEGVTIEPDAPVRVVAAGRALRASVGPIGPAPSAISVRPVSESGTPAEQRLSIAVQPVPDAPPTLELVKPEWSGEELLAPAHATLAFGAEASDDLGLQVLGLAYSLFDAQGVWRTFGTIQRAHHDGPPIYTTADEPVEFSARLPLPRLKAEAGGTLIITLLAVDTRVEPFGEPQHARVGPVVIRLAPAGEAGSCSGKNDGWIQTPSENPGGEGGGGQSSDTWTSDAPDTSDPRSGSGDQGGTPRPDEGPTDEGPESDAGPEGAAAIEETAEDLELTDPILTASGAPRRANPSGQRTAERAGRDATETPDDRRRDVPEAYRDIVIRYFMLLNESPRSSGGAP